MAKATKTVVNNAYLVGEVMNRDGDIFLAADPQFEDRIDSPLSGEFYAAIVIGKKHRQWVAAAICKELTLEEWADVVAEVDDHFEGSEPDNMIGGGDG